MCVATRLPATRTGSVQHSPAGRFVLSGWRADETHRGVASRQKGPRRECLDHPCAVGRSRRSHSTIVASDAIATLTPRIFGDPKPRCCLTAVVVCPYVLEPRNRGGPPANPLFGPTLHPDHH
jgi:hypothetical protein